jgi:hypothetical protein
MEQITPPECALGYPREQLRSILGNRLEEFDGWMYGQTAATCDTHGLVVYSWDVSRFLAGQPVVD